MKTKAVDPDTLRVMTEFVRHRPDTNFVEILPDPSTRTGLLARDVYDRVNRVLTHLGGKWSRKAKAHEFPHETADSLADKVASVLETGSFVRSDDMGFFPTPTPVAASVIRLAALGPGVRVLEPSAGTGNLLKPAAAIVGPKNAYFFEIDHRRAAELSLAGYHFLGHDFMEPRPLCNGIAPFDRVVMNPPFARLQDVAHVRRAWDWLAPGGTLVSVMSPGFTFRKDRVCEEFREFVSAHGGYTSLPDGSFRVAGTDVRTVLVAVRKPA